MRIAIPKEERWLKDHKEILLLGLERLSCQARTRQ
jgi:hypothetical protein